MNDLYEKLTFQKTFIPYLSGNQYSKSKLIIGHNIKCFQKDYKISIFKMDILTFL